MSTPPFLDLPSTGRAVRVATDRGEFAALEATPRAIGRPPSHGTAVLVPGFTGSKEDFVGILGPLAHHGYRVIAIDQRGQYESRGPDDRSAYAMAELVADVLAVIEATGDAPVHLVGHSFGGLVCRGVALAEPKALRSLTLIGSGPAAIPTLGERQRLELLNQALDAVDLETIWRGMRALDEANNVATPADPAVAEFLYRRWMSNSPAGLRAFGDHLLTEPDRLGELAEVPLPKLVVHGDTDYVWPVELQDAMAERLDARLWLIPGAAHSPAAEQADTTAEVLAEFWSEVEAAGRAGTAEFSATGLAGGGGTSGTGTPQPVG